VGAASSEREDRPAAPREGHTAHQRTHVLSVAGKPGAQVPLPLAFSTPVRTDLIRRAVVASQSLRRQPHSTAPTAGLRHSVEWSGKGRGVARTPRLMNSMTGAQAPNTVGGRPAHPPRVETIWAKKINTHERRLAFAAALAATRELDRVRARGHRIPDGVHLPLVVEEALEDIETAAEARRLLERLKLSDDIERARAGVSRRSGRARRRGRGRREPKGPLVVTSAPGRARGFRNLSGVDVVPVGRLGTEDLAPGGDPGRVTVFSRTALDRLRARLGETEGAVAS
jgi:large subunit ribosomal protein L4e